MPVPNTNDLDDLLAFLERALRIEDRDAALALCREAQASHPGDPRPWLAEARVASAWARMDEAREALDRAERRFGARPEILAQRVALARLSGDLSRRRALLEAAGDAARRCFTLWWEAVRLATDIGDWAEAERTLLSPPATNDRERAEACVLHGQLEAARGHWARALAHFQRALAIDPRHHFQVHVEIARAGLMLLDVDLAREHMRRVLEVQPSLAPMGERASSFSRSRIAAEIGQMLDEVGRDEKLADRLRAMGLVSADGQIAELRALALDHPGHATTAIHLLRALRRRGDLRASPANGSGGIPERIVQYWDSSPPPEVSAVVRSWVDLNPDWNYRLFDDAAAIEFLRARAPGALAAYLGAVHPAQRADVFRLAYLAAEGGFYADADDRCLAPLASWAPAGASFVGYWELCGAVANDFLGAAPGHPVISLALEGAIRAIGRGENEAIWQSTGPGALTRAFARAVSTDAALLDDSVLLDLGALRRSVAIHCHLAYKKSDRHWARAPL